MIRLRINLVETNNYINERLEKLQQVIKTLTEVLNSNEFETGVKNFSIDGERTFFYRKNFTRSKYIDQPYSNEEVYEMIMSGIEKPGDTTTNSMDLYLTLKNGSDGSVIGYGNPGQKEIFTYSTMFDSMDVPELANHYTHEWCHKLGFVHSFQRNRHRNHSVPYAVGDLVEEIAETLVGQYDVLLEGSGNEIVPVLDHLDDEDNQEENNAVENDLIFNVPITREWRTAECLRTLLKEVNILAPNRKKNSDGTIGDTDHENRNSDHNPWVFDTASNKGIVTALDVTHSPGHCDCNVLAQSLQSNKDSRVKYVIWNRKIMSSSSIDGSAPWTWRNYSGKNRHDHHIHISVKPEKSSYDSTADWKINVK